MFYNNDYPTEVVITTDSAGNTTSWGLKLIPREELELVEETITVRKYVRKPKVHTNDNCGIGQREGCAFDNWDWERHPVAMLHCPCPKCTPRYMA